MAEFLLIFVITLIVVVTATLAISSSRSQLYPPDRERFESILTRLLDGQLSDTEWLFFIDMPVHHDAELERIRQRCQQLQQDHGMRPRDQKARLDETGLIAVRHLLNQLQQDGSRSF